MGKNSQFDYYARCKRSAILWDWTQGIPLKVIEQRYTPNPYQGKIGYGDVRRFADMTRFHLRSAHEIANIMFLGKGPSEESIEVLLKQLEVGILADGLNLLSIPIVLERGEYLALYQAGVKREEDLWTRSHYEISDILSPSRATQLETLRPKKSGTEMSI